MDRKVMLKRFCAAVLCLVASMVAAYAVPADRTPFTVTKTDGSNVMNKCATADDDDNFYSREFTSSSSLWDKEW